MAEKTPILQLKGISKRFGGVVALNDVNMELRKGEVLGIVGDNGAGKSTLIKIISGVYQKDSGEIYLKGQKVEIDNPKDAMILGIETVYQDLALVDSLDLPLNIFLGREIRYKGAMGSVFGFLNFREMRQNSIKLLQKLKVDVKDLRTQVRYLSGGQRQIIPFARVIYWSKKIIVLDEPTSALGVKESRSVLNVIKRLKEYGFSIIIISHNLQHIFSVVDRIMVLRRGEKVGVVKAHETTADEVVSMITGAGTIEKL